MTEIAIQKRVTKDQGIPLIAKKSMNKENLTILNVSILGPKRNMKSPNLVKNTPDHLPVQGPHLRPQAPGQNVAKPKIIRKKGMKAGMKENLTESKVKTTKRRKSRSSFLRKKTEIILTLKKTETDIENLRKTDHMTTTASGPKNNEETKATRKIRFLTKIKNTTRTKTMITNKEIESHQIEDSQSTMTESTNLPEELQDIRRKATTNHIQGTLLPKTNTKNKASQNHTPNKSTNQASPVQKMTIALTTKTNPTVIQNPTLHVTQSNTLESSIHHHKNITRTESITVLHPNSANIVTIAIANTETIVSIVNTKNLLTTIKKNNPAFEMIHVIKTNRALTNMSQYKDNDQLTEKNTLPEKIRTLKITTDDQLLIVFPS